MRGYQSFSLPGLREIGPGLRFSRRELSDGTLFTFQLPQEVRLHVPDQCVDAADPRSRPVVPVANAAMANAANLHHMNDDDAP